MWPQAVSMEGFLRAQVEAYYLALAIQLPFALVLTVAARALRRTAARRMAWAFNFWFAAAVAGGATFQIRLRQGDSVASTVAVVLSVALSIAAWPLIQDVQLRLAEQDASDRQLRLRSAAFFALGVVAAALIAPGVTATTAAYFARSTALRALLVAAVSASLVHALKWARRAPSPSLANALRLLAVGHAAILTRQLFGILATFAALRQGETWELAIRIMQPAKTVVFGLMCVIAVLAEERHAIWHQGEALRAARERQVVGERWESLGRMAGGVAHDFANLLTVISASTELLLQRFRDANITSPPSTVAREDAGVVEELQTVLDAAKRATGITRQLRVFAREQPKRAERFLAGARIQAMDNVLRRLGASGTPNTLRISVGTDGALYMDPTQFDQIVLNLVSNASDASPPEGAIDVLVSRLTIGREHVVDLPEGTYMCISVADEGPGIPEALVSKIFEPFFTTKGERGTGLGLATVRSIVTDVGGAIRVVSPPDRGSRFEIYLPVAGDA